MPYGIEETIAKVHSFREHVEPAMEKTVEQHPEAKGSGDDSGEEGVDQFPHSNFVVIQTIKVRPDELDMEQVHEIDAS